MSAQRMVQVLWVFIWIGVLFLSGCGNFLTPKVGVTAREDARFVLSEDGQQSRMLQTRDLRLTFSYTESDNTFNLSGSLSFERSLLNSFPINRRFSLRMSFLDDQGRVLETVNITPLIGASSTVPREVPVRASTTRPAGATAIAFNYFGVFASGGITRERSSSQWNISYFPFY